MTISAPARSLLDAFDRAGVRSYAELGVIEARRMVSASVSLQADPPDSVEVRDLLVPGAEGLLPARLCVPAGRPSDGPLIAYFHGGGWVTGDILVADRPCRALAEATGLPVVSVEYRLAPETPYPGALEDAYAAVAWLADNAADLVGAERFVVAGDSAGGNLAAAVSILLRERGGPSPAAQLLLYPMLIQPGRGHFASQIENASGVGLDYADVEWFWRNYLAEETAGGEPTASPLLAVDLAGLPPACVVLPGLDPLHDEGTAYAERLVEAGVEATTIECEGTIHGFLWMDRRLPEAADARARIAAWIHSPAVKA